MSVIPHLWLNYILYQNTFSMVMHHILNVVLHLFLLTGQVQNDEIVDSKILQYCSIDRKDKKTIGELEQEFLQALQVL